LPDRSDQLNHVADAQSRKRILAALSSWLQRNLNAAAEQVDARFARGTWADIKREVLASDLELPDPH
jgi:hypothetical protein